MQRRYSPLQHFAALKEVERAERERRVNFGSVERRGEPFVLTLERAALILEANESIKLHRAETRMVAR